MRDVEDMVIAAIYQFKEEQGKATQRDDLLEMQKEMERLHEAY